MSQGSEQSLSAEEYESVCASIKAAINAFATVSSAEFCDVASGAKVMNKFVDECSHVMVGKSGSQGFLFKELLEKDRKRLKKMGDDYQFVDQSIASRTWV